MKSRHLLVVALVALACATPASADSSFYYQRTSLTNSIFDAPVVLGVLDRQYPRRLRQRNRRVPAQQLDPEGRLRRPLARRQLPRQRDPGTRVAPVRLPVLERRASHGPVRPLRGNVRPRAVVWPERDGLSVLLGERPRLLLPGLRENRAATDAVRPRTRRQLRALVRHGDRSARVFLRLVDAEPRPRARLRSLVCKRSGATPSRARQRGTLGAPSARSSGDRALPCGGRGRMFESCRAHFSVPAQSRSELADGTPDATARGAADLRERSVPRRLQVDDDLRAVRVEERDQSEREDDDSEEEGPGGTVRPLEDERGRRCDLSR